MKDKFLKVSRGFANTVIYFRVPADKVDEADAEFATFEDANPGCHTSWVSGEGIGLDAVDWADRALIGYGSPTA
jgi:hypothetical protein